MSATTAFFAVRAPVRVSVAQRPTQAKRSAQVCRAAAKDESKPEERVRPLVCDALERADGVAITEMAKAKCVHPDRPVAKLCKDCPRK